MGINLCGQSFSRLSLSLPDKKGRKEPLPPALHKLRHEAGGKGHYARFSVGRSSVP